MSIANILREHKQEILKDWRDMLHQELPVVRSHNQTAIENSIPDLLDAMSEALKSKKHRKVVFHSQDHGLKRSQFSDYSLGHVIKEYNFLRRVIFDQIDQYEKANDKERNTIIYVIDQAIEQASEAYHRSRQQVMVNAREIAEGKANDLELQDEKREQFIQSLTHDLNNPLNNVRACIDLLENDMDVNQVQTVMNIIRTSVNRAERLLKDFLDVSAIESDHTLPVNKVETNLSEELKNEISVYQLIYKRNIEATGFDDDILVEVDANLIKRAFDNLMNNALKHSKADSKIRVQLLTENNHLELKIKNEGQISEETMENIFDRYYQLNNRHEGWGIGLAFVQKVADAHQGQIECFNQENGVTFRLILPLAN